MLKRAVVHFAVLTILLGSAGSSAAQTMGLILNTPDAYAGYTLFEQLIYPTTYLINNEGRIVHTWENHDFPTGNMSYIQDNGDLLRATDPGGNPVFVAGGDAGMVQRLDWDGVKLWEFLYSDETVRHHHDIAPMENGNVLLLAWEYRTGVQSIAAGRNPALLTDGELWPEHIVEVEPVGATGGNIVWEWHLWDHLVQDFDSTQANFGVVGDHPELLDVNTVLNGGADWLHANAIDYNEDLDQVLISSPFLSEFFVIDHGTTTSEAAVHSGGPRGMGGDILYRWGNPENYDRGTATERTLYRQHDVHWIKSGLPGAGNILIFNNGVTRPGGNYSTADEVATSVDMNGDYPTPAPGVPHAPAAALWSYTDTPPGDLFSGFISGVQRQPNGNTLICSGANGTFLEVKLGTEEDVWRYINPVNSGGPQMQGNIPVGNTTFRAHRYALDFVGFTGRDLTPGPPVEIDPAVSVALIPVPAPFELAQNYPNPVRPATTIAFSLTTAAGVSLVVYDIAGRHVETLVDRRLTAGDHRVPWIAARRPSGVYFYTLRVDGDAETRKMVVTR